IAIQNTQIQLSDVEDLLKEIRNELVQIESLVRERAGVLLVETIACYECDAPGPPSLAAALEAGWRNLLCDKGPKWNYLGLCPGCREETAVKEPAHPVPQQPEAALAMLTDQPKAAKSTLF